MYTKHLLGDFAFIQQWVDYWWVSCYRDCVYLTQLQVPKNYRLTLNSVLEQLSKRSNCRCWILLNSLGIKIYMNIRERNSFAGQHDSEAGFWIPLGKRYCFQRECSFPKRDLSMKNLKPVALSFLLINSKITGRLEMKKGTGVTYSHRWNSSEALERKGVKRVWSENLRSKIRAAVHSIVES